MHAVAAGVGYSADAIPRHPDCAGWCGSGPAIQRALADAAVAPDQVVHINAHATSTPAGDVAEAMAIRRAIGSTASEIIVSATKSMTGHLLGGAGGVESIATICALRDSVAPPTINLEDLDDEVSSVGIRVATEPLESRTCPAL